jgi:thiamine pyrophosphate-dependent acetolactate synthase large subunit-like protein
MQLGSLSTVAARAQKNLCIVIMDNGAYQITGGQKTTTEQGADIVGIARASGLTQSVWAADEDAFVELIGRSLKEDGPWLIGCRIDNQKPVDTTERDPARIRDNFMRGLGVRK